jgi:phospholipid/cholesterol/gamma-HCH transport system substrate-binding protein
MYADVQIQSNMMPFVRKDSTAVIRKRFGVAGDSFIHISRGFETPLDWEFAVIQASAERAPTESVGEILVELRSKLIPMIDDTQTAIRTMLAVVEEMKDPQGNLQQLMSNANTITSKISQGEGLLGRLLFEEKLVNTIEALVVQLNTNMKRLGPIFDDLKIAVENISQISSRFDEQSTYLPEITRNLKDALNSVQTVMKDLSHTTPELPGIAESVGQAADSIPVLILQTQQVMDELDRLIRQLQTHWLIGGGTAPKAVTSTRISPAEVNQ